jgi:hypothetical protein
MLLWLGLFLSRDSRARRRSSRFPDESLGASRLCQHAHTVYHRIFHTAPSDTEHASTSRVGRGSYPLLLLHPVLAPSWGLAMDLLDELWREVFEQAASKELAYFSSHRRDQRRLPRPSTVLRLVSRWWKVRHDQSRATLQALIPASQALADPLFFRVIPISEPPSPKVALVAHVLANEEYCSDIARCTWRVRIGMAFDPEGMDGTILAYLDHLAALLARTRRLRRLEVQLNQAPSTVAMVSALIIPMGKKLPRPHVLCRIVSPAASA